MSTNKPSVADELKAAAFDVHGDELTNLQSYKAVPLDFALDKVGALERQLDEAAGNILCGYCGGLDRKPNPWSPEAAMEIILEHLTRCPDHPLNRLAVAGERIAELERELDEAMKLLAPTCQDETLLGAIRNLQQAHISEKDNAEQLEQEKADLQTENLALGLQKMQLEELGADATLIKQRDACKEKMLEASRERNAANEKVQELERENTQYQNGTNILVKANSELQKQVEVLRECRQQDWQRIKRVRNALNEADNYISNRGANRELVALIRSAIIELAALSEPPTEEVNDEIPKETNRN